MKKADFIGAKHRSTQRGQAMMMALLVSAIVMVAIVNGFTLLNNREKEDVSAAEVTFAQFFQKDITTQAGAAFADLIKTKMQDGSAVDSSSLSALRASLPSDGVVQIHNAVIDLRIQFSLPDGNFTPAAKTASLNTVSRPGHPADGLQARKYRVREVATITTTYSPLVGYSTAILVLTNDLCYYDIPMNGVPLGAGTPLTIDSALPVNVNGTVLYAQNLTMNNPSASLTGAIRGSGAFSSSSSFTLNGSSFSLSDSAANWRYNTEFAGFPVLSSANPANFNFDTSTVATTNMFASGAITDSAQDIQTKLYYRTDCRVRVVYSGGTISSVIAKNSSDVIIGGATATAISGAFSVGNTYGAIRRINCAVGSLPAIYNSYFVVCVDNAGLSNQLAVGITGSKDLSTFNNSATQGFNFVTPNPAILSDNWNSTNSVPTTLATPELFREASFKYWN